MNSERQYTYTSALELTRQMLSAARAQDWDALTRIETQRAQLVEEAATANAASTANLSAAERGRIAAIIGEIESDNVEILERVQSWREDAKILLRVKD